MHALVCLWYISFIRQGTAGCGNVICLAGQYCQCLAFNSTNGVTAACLQAAFHYNNNFKRCGNTLGLLASHQGYFGDAKIRHGAVVQHFAFANLFTCCNLLSALYQLLKGWGAATN